MTKKNNNKGFSLVELIVVIAIMAILVGALAPQLLKYIEKSRKSSDIQAAGAIFTAVQTAVADPMVEESTIAGSNWNQAGTSFGKEVLNTLGGTVPTYKSKTYGTASVTVSIDPGTNNVLVTLAGSGETTDITSTGANSHT